MERRTDPPSQRRVLVRIGAGGALAFLLIVFGAGGTMLAWLRTHAAPAHSSADSAQVGQPSPATEPVVAGSGVALPILEHLAEAFTTHAGATIRVAPSIGSGGGLAALMDGAIDMAVVSRPLQRGETSGHRVLPFATSTVILAGGRDAPRGPITPDRLLALFAGLEPARVILREPGDSGTTVAAAAIEGLASAASRGAATRGWRVVVTDQEMEAALLADPEALGLFDGGIINLHALPLHAIPLEGVDTAALRRTFTLVLPEGTGGAAVDFAAFVCSAAGRRIIADAGYGSPGCRGGGKGE